MLDSRIHNNESANDVSSKNSNGFQMLYSRIPNNETVADQWQTSKAVIDVQNSDQGQTSNIVIDGIFAGQNSAKMVPLMSLTLTRKEKRKEKSKVKKKKKQNDLRLLLDKKNTQKQSENFYCTKNMLL
jgi:hypothetical protein